MSDFKAVMFGIVIFGALFTIFGIQILGDIASRYSIDPGTSYATSFNKLNESFELSNQMSDKIYNSSISEQSTYFAMSTGAFGSVRLLFNSFSIVKSMVEATAEILMLPPWIITTAMVLFSIVIISIILGYIFRTNI